VRGVWVNPHRGRQTIPQGQTSKPAQICLPPAGCAIVVSHDRWFLDRLATHVLAAEGDGKWTFFEGNYQEYEDDRLARLGRAFVPPFATLA